MVAISGAPFTVVVAVGLLDASNFTVTTLSTGSTGVVNTATIQTKDLNGNNAVVGGVNIACELLDENAAKVVDATVTDNSDGTYTASVTSNNAYGAASFKCTYSATGAVKANYYTDYAGIHLYGAGEDLIETTINHDWGLGVPISGFPASDYWKATWAGWVVAPATETFTISTDLNANTGLRVTIGGTVVIDAWDPTNGATNAYGTIQLTSGSSYTILVELREQTGYSKIDLSWESASITKATIPSSAFSYTKLFDTQSYEILSSGTDATQSVAAVITGNDNSLGAGAIAAGTQQTFEITLKDAFGNVQTSAGNEQTSISCILTPTGADAFDGVVQDAGQAGVDGKYHVVYTPVLDIAHTIMCTYSSTTIQGFPYTISMTPAAASGETSTAVILSSGSEIIAGEQQTFTIYVRDVYDNMCNCDGTDYSITFSLAHENTVDFATTDSVQATMTGSPLTNEGVWTIMYTATKTGNYTPSITITDTTTNGAVSVNSGNITPATIAVRAALASYTTTTVTQTPIPQAAVNALQTVEVTVKDIYSNVDDVVTDPGSGGDYYFYCYIDDNDEIVISTSNTPTGTEGTYDISYTPTHDGPWIFNCKLACGTRSTGDGLTGNYYNNRWLNGNPIQTRLDAVIEFDWDTGLVTPTAKDYVSVQWTGYIRAKSPEAYTFTVTAQDGARLYIEDQLVIDEFLNTGAVYQGSFTFGVAGKLYAIQLEWRENTSNADVKLEWQTTAGNKEVIPTEYLHSCGEHIVGSPSTITVV